MELEDYIVKVSAVVFRHRLMAVTPETLLMSTADLIIKDLGVAMPVSWTTTVQDVALEMKRQADAGG